MRTLTVSDGRARRVAGLTVAVCTLVLGFAADPTGALEEDLAPLEAGLERAALDAVVFDPWTVQEDELPERRVPIDEYQTHTQAAASETQNARILAEERLFAFETVRDAALDHRADMEEEVEGFSISMWVLGDLGLQEAYGSEAERARQAQPVIAVTAALIERVEAADAALAAAEADVEAASIVLAERITDDDAAQLLARNARQIGERFESMVVARSQAIDRWTHEVLSEEVDEVSLVTINSVTVQVPISVPDDRGAATGEEIVQADSSSDGAETAAQPAPEDVPTQPTSVAIGAVIVNEQIAAQVQALIGAARSDGINLHGSGFRTREDQITLRLAHCGTSGFDIFERPSGECSPPTARPGASEHEMGLAVDFTVDGEILTWGSPGFEWMVANAGAYGLINLPSEAWHWSTTGG